MCSFFCAEPGCGMRFKRREHLVRHERKHSNVKPFSCHPCGRSFSRSDALKRHIKHHGKYRPKGRTSNACDLCHDRKIRCDDEPECAKCREINVTCHRTRTQQTNNAHEQGRYTHAALNSPTGGSSGSRNYRSDPKRNSDMTVSSHHRPRGDRSHGEGTNTDILLPPLLDIESIATAATVTTKESFNDGATPLFGGSRQSCAPLIDSNMEQYNGRYTAPVSPTAQPDLESCRTQTYPRMGFTEDCPLDLNVFSTALLKKEIIDRYFSDFHCHWPFLHKPSFDQAQCTFRLRLAISMLGALVGNDSNLHYECRKVHKWLSQHLLGETEWQTFMRQASDTVILQHLQALLLNILFAWYAGEKDLLDTAFTALPILTTWVHELGYFHGIEAVGKDERAASNINRWLIGEQKKRLGVSVFRLDCYFNLQRGYSPSIRLANLCLRLPCSEAAWNAMTVGEWQTALAQAPPGREDQTLASLYPFHSSKVTEPGVPFTLPEDVELAMCVMQFQLWKEARVTQDLRSHPVVSQGSCTKVWWEAPIVNAGNHT